MKKHLKRWHFYAAIPVTILLTPFVYRLLEFTYRIAGFGPASDGGFTQAFCIFLTLSYVSITPCLCFGAGRNWDKVK
jgi:hypothetical protein